MPRVLLLIPSATYRAHDFVAAAAALELELVVASDRRQALSAVLGDRALTLPLRRPGEAVERIEELHARAPLDAVVAVDDQGVRVAALAAERLGLRGNPPQAAERTRDKGAMRAALEAAGVPQPAYRLAGATDDVAAFALEVGLPCVVKPLALSASRGVIRADSPAGAAGVAERVRAILAEAGEAAGAALLVERYLPGEEVAIEGLLRGGRLELLALFDKPDPLEGPYFEETLFVTPSRHPAGLQQELCVAAGRAAAALGLTEGPVHAELRTDGERVWVLELAARSIGGLCSRALRFGVGVTLEELILRHALGLELGDVTRERPAAGVMMLPIPHAGVLERVGGQEEARAVEGIEDLVISVAPGRPVRSLPEGDRYLGFLFARAETPELVERALREAHGRLEVAIGAPRARSPAASVGADALNSTGGTPRRAQ